MPTQKRPFPPQKIHRFNYWEYFPPLRLRFQGPTCQRNGEFPEVAWNAPLGQTAAHRHNQHTFHLHLNATPDIWAKEVFPVHHVKLADIPNRQFFCAGMLCRE